jgi:hypothetical protein
MIRQEKTHNIRLKCKISWRLKSSFFENEIIKRDTTKPQGEVEVQIEASLTLGLNWG